MSQNNASNRKDVAKAEKKARAEDVARGDVLRGIMHDAPGRAWIWNRLSAANVFSSVFSDNPYRMAFLEGHRTAGLELLNDIMEHCPQQFIKAMSEANGRRDSDRADSERAANSAEPDGGDIGPVGENGLAGTYDIRPDPTSPSGYEEVRREGAEPRQH